MLEVTRWRLPSCTVRFLILSQSRVRPPVAYDLTSHTQQKPGDHKLVIYLCHVDQHLQPRHAPRLSYILSVSTTRFCHGSRNSSANIERLVATESVEQWMRSHCASDLCPDSSVRKLPPAAVQKRSNARRQIDATSQRGQTDRRTPTQAPRNHSQLYTASVARSLLLRIPLNCWRITRHRLQDLRAPTGVHQLTGQQCPPARCPEPRYRRLATRRGDRTAHRSAFSSSQLQWAKVCSKTWGISARSTDESYKKLRYRKEHSTSVVPSWRTL